MNPKQAFWAAAYLAVGAVVGVTLRPGDLSAQGRVVQLNNHVNTLRTIPKEYGRVVGTVTAERYGHSLSLVLEATDGTVWIVPFDPEHPLYTFPRQ